MHTRLRRALPRHWRPLTVLAATTALFAYHDLFAFLATTEHAGRDLAGNHAFTWLMHHNLSQGAIVAWTDRFLLGFPAFASYPPLFFMVPALATFLTGGLLPLHLAFNGTVLLSVFLLPLATWWALRPLGRDTSLLAGCYTLLTIFVYPPVSIAYQTFSVGLVAQAFAILLLTVSTGLLLRVNDHTAVRATLHDRTALLAGVLLALTILAHPFVGMAGLLIAATLAARHRTPSRLAPAALGLLLAAPWLVPAVLRSLTLPAYTFAPARPGWVLLLLLPLTVLGGLQGRDRQALLAAFAILLGLSTVETPFIAQELRFYTYALLLAAVLAGTGAARLATVLADRIDRRIAILALLVPVATLALHATVPATWTFTGDATPLYDALDDMEQGDIIVETSNTSIFDSYTLQASIPLRTHHDTANGVHIDQTRNATAILQAEHWISADPIHTPLCRDCTRSAPPDRVASHLDTLGIDYVVLRTATAASRLNGTFTPLGTYGDYRLFAAP